MGNLTKKLFKKNCIFVKPQIDASAIRNDVYKKVVEEYKPIICLEMVYTTLAFLRCERGYGKKRLQEFLRDFNEFAHLHFQGKTSIEDIKEMLLSECDFNPDEEYIRIAEEAQKEQR
ncbi:MAG: hypothetical protein J6M62_11325 [Selenomonadaceae bacterium]|nr:hypothetical protein [Selenomonadaceae bacterium]MBO6305645.1 hypothetical protein [Selenomonadaceae bacterium]